MNSPYPPGPSGLWPFAIISRFRRDPIGLLRELSIQFGDHAHVRIGTMHLVALSHPDDIEEVLVRGGANFSKSPTLRRARRLLGNGLLTSEEPAHREQRRRMTGAFTGEKIRVYDDVVADYAHRQTAHWKDGQVLDFAEAMKHLTLSVIGKVLFGDDFEIEAASIERDFTTALDRLRPFRAPLLANQTFTEWIPGTKGWDFRKARERLDSVVLRMIQLRRAQPDSGRDLLSVLLSCRDEESTGDRGMIDSQARDEVLTLMLAGHETVAHALTWTWYLLALHPEVETKLHEELDAVLKGGVPTVEHQPHLPYTRMVLTESMRLFPPVWVIARQALRECTVGPYRLPAGTVVSMCQFVVHHDARWYSNPERFDPDRWSTSADTQRPKYAYFPFGGGSRHCLGERFAWMEATLILAVLAQKWRACLAPGAKVEMDPGFTLRPKNGLQVTLRQRVSSHLSFPSSFIRPSR